MVKNFTKRDLVVSIILVIIFIVWYFMINFYKFTNLYRDCNRILIGDKKEEVLDLMEDHPLSNTAWVSKVQRDEHLNYTNSDESGLCGVDFLQGKVVDVNFRYPSL